MRIPTFPIIFVLVAIAGPPADASPRGWLDWLRKPRMPQFDRPYLDDAKTPQDIQWETDEWNPESWTEARGSKQAVLRGLEQADIIRSVDFDEEASELDVGYGFLRLANKEKIRVVKYIDYAYGATNNKNGAIEIEYDRGWLTRDLPVGLYTQRYGLQLH